MELVHKLNLNKHPKDNENLSLVNALNIKVNPDGSCLSNEESIKENTFINDWLVNHFTSYYNHKYTFNKIISVIPVINELILLVNVKEAADSALIFRYREKTSTQIEAMELAHGNLTYINNTVKYQGLKYYGGKINATFTYNVENELILAIAESGVENVDIPLRVINIGQFGVLGYEDVGLTDGELAINPEIKIPTVNDVEYIKGSAYKGWYYLYIRYQINDSNKTYTQWYPMGFPIYVDTLNKAGIIKYVFNRETHLSEEDAWKIIAPKDGKQGFCVGCTDHFSDETNIAQETFKINFTNPAGVRTYYQIGIVCCSKSYTKAFKTRNIINYVDSYTDVGKGTPQKFIFDVNSLDITSVDEFIIDNYNPFNVENIINYKNRLYIANYKEHTANDKTINKTIINNIKIELHKEYFDDEAVVYDVPILNNQNETMLSNQYTSHQINKIPLHSYLGVQEDTIITVKNSYQNISYTDKASYFNISTIDNINYGYAKIVYSEYVGPTQTRDVFINNPVIINGLNTIYFNEANNAIINGQLYINTKLSFNNRKLNSTLIPGECYNFFIHFVDKYGHATNGYKIENHIKWTVKNNFKVGPIKIEEIIPYKIIDNCYAAIPINDDVFIFNSKTNKYEINSSNIKFYSTIDTVNFTLSNEITENTDTLKTFILSNIFDEKYIDFKWYQLIESADKDNFNIFINSKDERLFKVPISETFIKVRISNDEVQKGPKYIYKHIRNMIKVKNVTIPNGYIGYFISYEQYEPMRRFSGMLTRADFISQSSYDIFNSINVSNKKKSNTMMFYSNQLDVVDSIKADFNLIRFEGSNNFDIVDIPNWDYYQRTDGFDYCYDMNKPLIDSIYSSTIRPMPEYTIVAAGSAKNNRIGLGTGIKIKDSYGLFPEVRGTGSADLTGIMQYYVTLINSTRNIYTNDDKKLIPLSQVIYNTEDKLIEQGYNGHWTYDGVLIYENSGIAFNDADKKVYRISDNTEYYKSEVSAYKPHTYQNDIPFLAYVQFPVCDTVFYESKRFKNEPDPVIYITYIDKEKTENSKYARGSIVTPNNSIDLFENPQGSSEQFYPKIFNNYADFKNNITQFTKTIRRSDIISDESTHNSWKKFSPEAYKNIIENKGKITNIIGVGYMFLVHTEHSLFMFDANNMIKTLNTDLQIIQPDAFDVEYKEIFTSTLGYGGLQDKNAWILDKFGYIFYNNDSNNFYRFDNNTLTLIDENIINWLNKYKPYNVRFANDKFNNRLLIKMNYNINNEIKNIVLSYNYAINSFISLHSYYFEEGINTKNNLYLKCNNIHEGCALHQFINDDSSFGEFDNIIDNIGIKTIKPSKISIIINPQYLTIKMLEHITYKLTKLANSVNIDNTTLPVEGEKQPFSGNTIRIYNNLVDTGELDITVDDKAIKNIFCDYTKPYWHLGNWNFNYLMNNVKNHKIEAFVDNYSRLYGNYFIIEFTFNNIDKLKVEFEELDYKLIKD